MFRPKQTHWLLEQADPMMTRDRNKESGLLDPSLAPGGFQISARTLHGADSIRSTDQDIDMAVTLVRSFKPMNEMLKLSLMFIGY